MPEIIYQSIVLYVVCKHMIIMLFLSHFFSHSTLNEVWLFYEISYQLLFMNSSILTSRLALHVPIISHHNYEPVCIE